jgi:hypothetical protein
METTILSIIPITISFGRIHFLGSLMRIYQTTRTNFERQSNSEFLVIGRRMEVDLIIANQTDRFQCFRIMRHLRAARRRSALERVPEHLN